MNVLNTDNVARYDEMKKDVDSRFTLWYLGLPKTDEKTSFLLEMVVKSLMTGSIMMGPFERNYFKEECMGIPRVPGNYIEPEQGVSIAFASPNSEHANVARASWDMVRNLPSLRNIDLDLIMVQLVQKGTDSPDSLAVVNTKRFVINQPVSLYEHPPGHRLWLAVNGSKVPEQAVSIYNATEVETKCYPDLTCRLTHLYRNQEIDVLPQEDFRKLLFKEWV